MQVTVAKEYGFECVMWYVINFITATTREHGTLATETFLFYKLVLISSIESSIFNRSVLPVSLPAPAVLSPKTSYGS